MYLYYNQATQCHLYKKEEPNYAQNISISLLKWFWENDARAMEIRCCSRQLRFRWGTLDVQVFFFSSFGVKELVIYSHNYFYHLKIVDIYSQLFCMVKLKHSGILLWKVCLNLVCQQRRTKDWCHSLQWRQACHCLWLCVSDSSGLQFHRDCWLLLTSCLDPHPWDSLVLVGGFQIPVLS